MKGARAEPFANTSSAPRISRKITMGAIHHFFPSRRNCRNSLMIENLLTKFTAQKVSIAQ